MIHQGLRRELWGLVTSVMQDKTVLTEEGREGAMHRESRDRVGDALESPLDT